MKRRRNTSPKRPNKITICLSDIELIAIETHCKRNKIKSKAGLIRDITIRHILGNVLDDYPTLFNQTDLDKLVKRD